MEVIRRQQYKVCKCDELIFIFFPVQWYFQVVVQHIESTREQFIGLNSSFDVLCDQGSRIGTVIFFNLNVFRP